jgi:hypothetical protein
MPTMSQESKEKKAKVIELARKKHILLRTLKLMEKRNPSLKQTSPHEKPPMNLLEEYEQMEKQGLVNLVNLIDEYVPRPLESSKPEPECQSSDPKERS